MIWYMYGVHYSFMTVYLIYTYTLCQIWMQDVHMLYWILLPFSAILADFFVVGRKNHIWRKKISGENVSDQCIWAFNVIYENCPFCNKTEFICDLAGNNNIFWLKDHFLIMAIHLTLGHGCVWVTVTSVCDSNSAGELLSTRLGDISANDKLKY